MQHVMQQRQALQAVDSGRLGAICIENVCYVVKHSDNPRVMLLALGALNNLTKACATGNVRPSMCDV